MLRAGSREPGLMRITYLRDGTAQPVFEPGDFVRLVRDEPGPEVTARAGDWGRVVRNQGARGLDVLLAGHSRPRTTDMPMVTGIPARLVVPCDRMGVGIGLQRDLRRHER